MSIINIKDLNINSLSQQFENAIVRSRTGQVISNLETIIDVKIGDDILFTYNPDYNEITNLNQKYGVLKDILKMSGAYEMVFEFTPNNILNLNSDNTYYIYNQNIFRKQIETFNDYQGWFKNIFSCFSGNIVLIPDTNILLYCYYSNYLKSIIQQNQNKVSFCLSRLTILEIERQINDLTEKIKSQEKKIRRNENKNDEIDKQYIENKKQKRLKFQAIGEISEMIKDGASIIPTYNENLLTSFSKAAGNSFADSWIRMEIYDYIRSRQNNSLSDTIILTSDLLNALMCVAENINTIYIYNRNQISTKNGNLIDNLLYTISNSFEEINLIIKSNASSTKEEYKINGIWEGKTVEEWSNKKVKFTKI